MGFYKQPNDWTCGPFALKHALVTMGRLTHEKDIEKVAHPHWWSGTDEVKLAKAARHFGYDLSLVRRRQQDLARVSLQQYLTRKVPVLLCVDGWSHWITAVAMQNDRFVYLDSKEEPVLKYCAWPQLRNRWKYQEVDQDTYYYDLHPVRPLQPVPANANFSVDRAKYLRRPENRDLAKYWDAYLEDLMEICTKQSKRFAQTMSMGEFLRRNQELLLSRVCYWHGHIQREQIERILRNFRFVAETYGLVIPQTAAKRALVDITVLLAFWAASVCGIGAMYTDPDAVSPRRRRPTR